ncbi:MAG: 4-hydroxy-tetrahydrodipicolinate synthase [Chloroflexi bacterium]|nr:4-hydroxy-tetrahydrodipicolinate synthase [Chloroflexota bacterium]
MTELGRLFTAMVTPFAEDGGVDYAGAQRLALALLESGSDGLVVAGTTGEAPTLSQGEKLSLFEAVKQAVGDRGAVIANTGTHNTRASVDLTREAEATGVDGILAVTPYYNKPTQEGLFRHFEAIAAATRLPVIMYNVPSRTSVNMTADTAIRLSQVRNIAGTKEASGDLDQIKRIITESADGFLVWSGSDEDTLAIVAAGGYGAVGVISHLVGQQVSSMIELAATDKTSEAQAIHERLVPLIKALFTVSNPIPLKHAMNQIGFSVGGLRLPLCEPDDETGAEIMAEVRRQTIDLAVAV